MEANISNLLLKGRKTSLEVDHKFSFTLKSERTNASVLLTPELAGAPTHNINKFVLATGNWSHSFKKKKKKGPSHQWSTFNVQ